jgi:hypothetical protein
LLTLPSECFSISYRKPPHYRNSSLFFNYNASMRQSKRRRDRSGNMCTWWRRTMMDFSIESSIWSSCSNKASRHTNREKYSWSVTGIILIVKKMRKNNKQCSTCTLSLISARKWCGTMRSWRERWSWGEEKQKLKWKSTNWK